MTTMKKLERSRKGRVSPGRPGTRTLGIRGDDSVQLAHLVRDGFSATLLGKLQKATGLPWERISSFVGIPSRTITRRQHEGKLAPGESDRVWRAASIFDMAVDLFEGDSAAARRWLLEPQPALGGEVPLELASTDVGAREVEKLIGRLEHGVFT